MLVVVFPQPPFWLMIAIVRMANLPWRFVRRVPAPVRRPAWDVGYERESPIPTRSIGEVVRKSLALWDTPRQDTAAPRHPDPTGARVLTRQRRYRRSRRQRVAGGASRRVRRPGA